MERFKKRRIREKDSREVATVFDEIDMYYGVESVVLVAGLASSQS